MRIFAVLGASALLGLLSFGVRAAGLPLVISATVDYTHNTLTISGQNFGASPMVTLDSLSFGTQSSGSSQIVANFPSGMAPASFTPGTYFLTLQFRNQLPAIFAVSIGANGAPGLAGPPGVPGSQGVAGAPGPAGPAGPQGIAGPMGPPGVTGATGPAGPTGAQGLQGIAGQAGPQGLQGPAGATGLAGANGTNGTGAPICAASDSVVSYQGALVCKSTLPRYVDNLDGTVTDNLTGLMWEQTTSTCSGEITCYSTQYEWTSSGIAADGNLFTIFLATLNGGDYYNPADMQNESAGAGSCFANHCDWRMPTITELKAIIASSLPGVPGCFAGPACIDPAFGPTEPFLYFSSSTAAGNTTRVWNVFFNGGSSAISNKLSANFARAVRGGQ